MIKMRKQAKTSSTPSQADALAGRDYLTAFPYASLREGCAIGAVRGSHLAEDLIFNSLVLVKSAAGEPDRWAVNITKKVNKNEH
jgi:hypothetical protein